MMRQLLLIACGTVAVIWLANATAWAFECPARIDEARTAQGYAEEARLIAERL